ncbi:hypothetical protein GGD83_003139 [Rhodoblastus sphagnicola]|nr:hypothetical protein [Rhodoblastus sphagnicola]
MTSKTTPLTSGFSGETAQAAVGRLAGDMIGAFVFGTDAARPFITQHDRRQARDQAEKRIIRSPMRSLATRKRKNVRLTNWYVRDRTTRRRKKLLRPDAQGSRAAGWSGPFISQPPVLRDVQGGASERATNASKSRIILTSRFLFVRCN